MPANEYYDSSGTPATSSSGASAPIRAEFDAIEAGFNKLPVMLGHANEVVVVNSGATALTTAAAVTLTALTIASAGNINWNGDLYLYRDAANILAQRNGVNPQTFRVYNTFTDASNYERGEIAWVGNVLHFHSSIAGTGVPREVRIAAAGAGSITLRTNSVQRWRINEFGHFLSEGDNLHDIGASGATRPRSIYVGTDIVVGADLSQSHGLQVNNIRGAMLYASTSGPANTGVDTNWMRSPKNTVTMFVGDSDVTSGYADTEYSGAIRYNGSAVGWGDLAYFPIPGAKGHFRFYFDGANVGTGVANATVGVGTLNTGTIVTPTATALNVTSASTLNLAATTGDINLNAVAPGNIVFSTGGTQRWVLQTDGHLRAPAGQSNTYDLGTTALRVRTGYFGTSVFTPVVDSGAAAVLDFRTNSGTLATRINHVASAVNIPLLTPSATGNAIGYGCDGNDANINVLVSSKGTGFISFRTNGGATEQVRILHTASAVNYLHIQGGAAASAVVMAAQGSDTDVVFQFASKGGGGIEFYSNAFASSTLQFAVTHTTSANRYIRVTGSNGGNPTISVSAGSLAITPDTHFAGDIAVNGGDLTTSQTTFNLLNGTAQTINFGGGASTVIQIGNIAGDFIIASSSIPINSQSTAYTAVAADANKCLLHPTADNNARTFTIPANASVAYKIGTAITFVNQINTVTIAINSDTLTLAGTGTTGSRTLAAHGVATAIKVTSTLWYISGTGLT